ncbi:MAG: hypothetical protein COX30_02120 [Candidatus Moranbacteria bacterium CG23_combo_of_CG06-09_8_20_14_all_39_10]|nr:MAG: hypothetical protein COX30_02120 [Candidatus Moranbacteria bacterium CG23_combo_of_CG06-09_8_20_14_all_39_10]
MKKVELEILQKMLVHKNKGLFSPADLFNAIGGGKREKEIHGLIARKFIDEVSREMQHSAPDNPNGVLKITFYRLSEKGRYVISAWYKRFWYFIKSDIKTVIIATIISIVTAVINNLLTK